MRRSALLASLVAPLALVLAGCSLPFGATDDDDSDCCTPTLVDTEGVPPSTDPGDFAGTTGPVDADAAGAPSSFTFVVGGFLGPTDSYVVSGTTLVHSHLDNSGDQDPELVQGEPTPEAWAAFRAELDALDAWSWDSTYLNVDVMDGTQWVLGVEWDGRTIQSSGSNAFPGSPGPEYGEQFERLIAAVEALAASVSPT